MVSQGDGNGQKGCGISVLGVFQDLLKSQVPQTPDVNSKLLLGTGN